MKKLLCFLFVLINIYASVSAETDSTAANPKDVESIDAIIASLYHVISGPAGEQRNWNRMRSLFLPEGKLVSTGIRPNGEVVKRVMTVEDYIINSGPYLIKNGFFETEIFRRQEVYGHIAHCFSTYESRNKAEDVKPFMRGINSIQLYNDGKRWWIVSVFWQPETKDLPIPSQYLSH